MFSFKQITNVFQNKHLRKVFHKNHKRYSSKEHPYAKTWNVISRDIPYFGDKKPKIYPEHADIVVIGGGFIGSSVAYWLKKRADEGLSVVVIEKDFSYKNAQTFLNLGKISQHYALPENIYLSKYSADFLRTITEHLGPTDIQYQPKNSLVLACDKYAEKLEENVVALKELGVKNEILTVEDLKSKFPWISTHDIQLGCIGLESEGRYDSYAFLKALVQKSRKLGAVYVNAEVTGFELEKQKDVLMEGVAAGTFQRINKVKYKTPDNKEYALKFAACVLAAGDMSAEVAKLAMIGTGDGLLQIPLPIQKRETKVYSVEDKAKTLDLSTPIVMDTSGLWFQRDGLENNIICGLMPLVDSSNGGLETNEYFLQVISPLLVNRVPHFKNAKVNGCHVETQDFNVYDDTGILGPHPYHNNLYVATGFGALGCTHAPGIGRAIAELIIDGQYTTIDLTRFGFDRLLIDEPMVESNIY